MKLRSILLLFAFHLSILSVLAQGESRENPIRITADAKANLLGVSDANTTTWFLVPQDAFAGKNLLTVSVGGKNCGDVLFLPTGTPDQTETLIITPTSTRQIKHLWEEEQGDVYVAISQDNADGTATFAFSEARPGEVRRNALQAQEGENTVPSQCQGDTWYTFTAPADTMVFLVNAPIVGNILDADGRIFASSSSAREGFRMRAGDVICFCLQIVGNTSFSIKFDAIPEGYYSDRPFDITTIPSFTLDIPIDPNATSDGAEQSERYWLYRAEQGGLMMWGTDDAAWTEGMWGVSVIDRTTGSRLNTPLTAVQAGMLTYTISVQAGHEYLIAQVIGHARQTRRVNVYTAFSAGGQGDSSENPIPLTLNESLDLGRTASTTHYYAFTAQQDGIYTATVHAGGQVRATTPQDGSWNISRDYSIQDRQMHIDDNIHLRAGEALLLEVSLTSNIDIHVGDKDAGIPNYSILITQNDANPEPEEKKPGEDLEHAIPAQQGVQYAIPQSADENYRPCFYQVLLPAGNDLVVTTQHPEAISSPSCISFTHDGEHWNVVNPISQLLSNADGSKKVGRQYTVAATAEDRTLYLYVEGVSFLYEGAQWSLSIVPATDAIQHPSALPATDIYNLQGQRLKAVPRRGMYIQGGKVIRN